MRILENARDIRYRRERSEERMMRIVLEERSPLRVELEAAAAEAGMIYRVQEHVSLSVELTPKSFDDRILYWAEDIHSKEVLLERHGGDSGALIRLERGSAGCLGIEVAALELEAARRIAQEFTARLGRQEKHEDGSRVCVSFWRDGDPLPESTDRFLDVVRWQDVSTNYSATTGHKLEHLMNISRAELEGGRLMLWHGKPGTGKTYALRALAYEWKPWCDIHYISDPEALLGRAGYLLHLLVHDTGSDSRWRLLVMEDTGELLSIDARQNVGQALSRLLNTTEGLLGQGLKVLFLITTNEELGKLNPAVTRPGRCLSEIEFRRFNVEEGNRWLQEAGCDQRVDNSRTLSDLYALLRGGLKVSQPQVGFCSLKSGPGRSRKQATLV